MESMVVGRTITREIHVDSSEGGDQCDLGFNTRVFWSLSVPSLCGVRHFPDMENQTLPELLGL